MEHQRRIATWTPAPPVARKSFAKSLAGVQFPGLTLFFVCSAVACVIALLALAVAQSSNLIAVLALATGVAISTVSAIMYLGPSGRSQTRPEWWAEIDTTDPTPRLRVKIQLSTAGFVYGVDNGELMLVDDWLVFEGERTSFSLASHDVAALRRRRTGTEYSAADFKLRDLAVNVRVKVTSRELHRDPERFLSSWVTRKFEHPTLSVLPPLEPTPESKIFVWRGYDSEPEQHRVLALFLPYSAGILLNMILLRLCSLEFRILATGALYLACLAVYVAWVRSGRRKALTLLAREVASLPAQAKAFESPPPNGSAPRPLADASGK